MGLADILAKVTAEAKAGVPEKTAAIGPAAIEFTAQAADPKAAVNGGGGGGITVRPWWDILPKTPTEVVERTLAEPAVVAPAAVVSKTILKLGGAGLLASGVGGFLFGRLFGGGGTQELQQAQDLTQEPDVTVTPDLPVDVTVDPTIKTLTDLITKLQLRSGAEIEIGAGAEVVGDIGTTRTITHTTTNSLIYNIQKTITETYPTQITVTKTVTTAAQAQEATQEQGMDWITLAIVGVLGLIGYSMFKKKAA